MRKESFLLEIGTEEIPARFINPALKQLAEAAAVEMKRNGWFMMIFRPLAPRAV